MSATPEGRLGRDARVLVTGGAGFIGSHLANSLVQAGARVRVLDCLDEQVHGAGASFPAHLDREVEAIHGDVRDAVAVRRALQGVTHVCHLAAAVGVGQSMYEIERYTDVNNRGTAVLLEALLQHRVERLVVASSMSIYGEGLYRLGATIVQPAPRSREQLLAGRWEVEQHGEVLEPVPTPEAKQPVPSSVYALSKYDQEQLCLMFGAAYDVPTVALRFFNAFGPHQSLQNPYTGVLAIFASRCLNGNPPLIFEDGDQQRDFVSVHDVAQACRLALSTGATGEVFNVGSGRPRSILEIAASVIETLGLELEPVVTGKYRVGDIRHCYAARVTLEAGLVELAQWLERAPSQDNFMHAAAELDRRGLTL